MKTLFQAYKWSLTLPAWNAQECCYKTIYDKKYHFLHNLTTLCQQCLQTTMAFFRAALTTQFCYRIFFFLRFFLSIFFRPTMVLVENWSCCQQSILRRIVLCRQWLAHWKRSKNVALQVQVRGFTTQRHQHYEPKGNCCSKINLFIEL